MEELGDWPQFVLTPDPGERHGIVNKEKGVMWAEYFVQGKGAHASRPWLSDCALKRAYDISEAVDMEFNKSTGEDDWQSSATMTQLQKTLYTKDTGYILDKSNAIADGAYLKKDLRFTENDDPESIKQRLEEINNEYNPGGSVNVRLMGPVCYTQEDNPRLKEFSRAVAKAEGGKVPLIVSAGASDMRFYSAKGLPCVTYGPTGGNHHASNEYVDISSLEKVYNAVRNYTDGVKRSNLCNPVYPYSL